MARKRYPPTDPREWLNRARSNLALAKSETEGALLEDLCFEAQQATEKAIKAMFVHRGISFPYTDDLKRLLKQLERSGVKIPKYVRQAHQLTPYAVVTRYPGLVGPVTKREYRRVVRIADAVITWATRPIEGKSP